MVKKEGILLEQIATNKQITGSMLRIILCCASKDRNQTELSRLLETKISNVSANVKKLIKMQILIKKKIDGVVLYTVNWDWSDENDPNQIDFNDLGYKIDE